MRERGKVDLLLLVWTIYRPVGVSHGCVETAPENSSLERGFIATHILQTAPSVNHQAFVHLHPTPPCTWELKLSLWILGLWLLEGELLLLYLLSHGLLQQSIHLGLRYPRHQKELLKLLRAYLIGAIRELF